MAVITSGLIYWCKTCDKWFHRGSLTCLVNHPEGQCCHYGDIQLDIDLSKVSATDSNLLWGDR